MKELREAIKKLQETEKAGRKFSPAKPDVAKLDASIAELTAISAQLKQPPAEKAKATK